MHLSFPLYLVMAAPLTMRSPRGPQALQLFTDKAEADSFAKQYPHTRRMELATPAAVADILDSLPGHYTLADVHLPGNVHRCKLTALAARCEELAAEENRLRPLRDLPPPPPAPPGPPPIDYEAQLRRDRELAYRRAVDNC